jgi:hypothetical protein
MTKQFESGYFVLPNPNFKTKYWNTVKVYLNRSIGYVAH